MRVKDWLVSQGHLTTAGRGPLSKENRERATAALKDGVTFDNWPLEETAKPSPHKRAKAIRDSGAGKGVKPVRSSKALEVAKGGEDLDIVEIAPYVHTETTHKAYEVQPNAKGHRVERSLREVCQFCRVSLVQCECGRPSIVATNGRGHVAVTIVEARSTLKVGNVWA